MPVLDHVFVVLITIVYPVAGFLSFRRLLRRVAAGQAVNRPLLYRSTFLSHWTLFIVCLVLWSGASRTWPALGFDLQPDLRFSLAVVLTLAGIAVLLLQLRQVKSASQDEIDAMKSRLGNMAIMIPHTRGELARFYGLAVTAGIVEEVLWRGFLIWYLSQFMPLWAAALASAVGFGLAHAYQGIANLPQITLVGAVFAALYVLSGSLWLPMVLHAAVDILQGRLAYVVVNRGGTGRSTPVSGAAEGISAS